MKAQKEVSVLEIHQDFYNESDRLALTAKKVAETKDTATIEKAERLRKLGFTGTKPVKRVEKKSKFAEKMDGVDKAISYFATKYPMHRFITEDSVKRICKKYGLIYGTADRFIGDVPDANLEQMERFKIADEDRAAIKRNGWLMDEVVPHSEYVKNAPKDIVSIKGRRAGAIIDSMIIGWANSTPTYIALPLEIVASVSDFNTEGMQLKDFKLSPIPVPDPIVLQPVVFEAKKYYLIVTAWGTESTDPEVFNSKHN